MRPSPNLFLGQTTLFKRGHELAPRASACAARIWLLALFMAFFALDLCHGNKAKAQQYRNEDRALFSDRDLAAISALPPVANAAERAALASWAEEIAAILKLAPRARPGELDLQDIFFEAVFVNALGYKPRPAEGEASQAWSLQSEFRTDVDLTRPDGVLGFFTLDHGEKDVRVVIELKRPGADLDERQDRKQDRRTPVDQAFSYAHKFDAVDWVIVSNFSELRLYHARSSKYALHFDLSAMDEPSLERRIFFQLLHRLNLIEVRARENEEAVVPRTLTLYNSRDQSLTDRASLN